MSIETEVLKGLKEINGSIEELTMCFVDGFGGVTVHQTLEEIKVINSDISEYLKRIADALEKQVDNQVKMNKQIIKNLTTDDAGQTI
jgi:SMC interacting uncharacterized protein involved in chromosome segregation